MSGALLTHASKALSAASSETTDNTTDMAIVWGNNLPGCPNPSHFRTVPGIVRNCFLTIVACVWAVQHPNVPNPRSSRFENWKQKLILLFFAFACPEISVIWAYRQWVGAARHRDDYNRKFYPTKSTSSSTWRSCIKPWFNDQVIARLRFIFGLDYTGVKRAKTVAGKEGNLKEGDAKKIWTLAHGFLLEMGGLVIHGAEGLPLVVCDVSQLSTPLDIHEELIQDKSIEDTFGKFLAVAQTTWFTIQCIARWIRHLPVTELEVLTIGFAFLNAFAYMFWLSKPQNMSIAFSQKMVPGIATGNEKLTVTGGDEPMISTPWLLVTKCVGPGPTLSGPRSRLYYSSSLRDEDEWKMVLQLGPLITLFGAIHLIPIFLGSFPTPLEKHIWAATAIWLSAMPTLILVTKKMKGAPQQSESRSPSSATVSPFVIVVCVLCLLARQALPFLALVALRSPPIEVYYNVNWASFLPHL